MRGRVFRGTHESMAALQPFNAPRRLQEDGITFGVVSEGCDEWYFNPFTLPGDATGISVSGLKRAGKSTFAKSCTLRLPWLQVYDVNGIEEDWRTRVMTRKSEAGSAEWLPIVNYLGANYNALGHGKRINLLGLLKRLTDRINVAINIAQQIGRRYDDPEVARVVSIAVSDLHHRNPRAVSEDLLRYRLRELTLDDIRRSYEVDRAETEERFADEFKEDPELRRQLGFDSNEFRHIDESYLEAARHAAKCFDILVSEAFGNVFGGSETLYEMLTQRFVLIDTEDIPENAVEMIEAVLMKAEASAIRYKQEEIGTDDDMTRIVPHLSVHDEEGSEAARVRGLMHLRYAANKQNKSRAYATSDMYLEQYEYQISEAGEIGTSARNLARQFIDGFDRHMYFKQSRNDDVLHEIWRRTKMPDEVLSWLPELQQGECVQFVRDHPAVRAKHILLPSEVALIDTESSRRRGASAVPVWEQGDLFETLMNTLYGAPASA